MKVILLAAGRGRRFGRRTRSLPKCLIPIGRRGENLLQRYLNSFRSLGLRKIVIVVGHQKNKILLACKRNSQGLLIRFIENKKYAQGSIVSLFCAVDELAEDCLIMDADVFFETHALKPLLSSPKSCFLLDPNSHGTGEEMMLMAKKNRPVRISKEIASSLWTLGEATGFFKVKKTDAMLLRSILKKMVKLNQTQVEYEDSYNKLMKKRKCSFVNIKGFWTEMDFEEDLEKIKQHRLG